MANYFNWDCTTGSSSLGPISGYFSGTTRVVVDGVSCLRFAVIGNDAGNQQMGADQTWVDYPFARFVGSPALYYRWRMRIEPGFRWGAGTAKTKSSRTAGGPMVNGSSQGQGYTGYVMSNGFLLGECDTAGCTVPGGGFNTDQNHLIPHAFPADGQWHEYIVKVKANSGAAVADAEFEAWADGARVGSANGFILHPNATHTLVEQWRCWMMTPYFQLNGTAQDGGVIYATDFSVDDVYNSLGAPPPPPPPADGQVESKWLRCLSARQTYAACLRLVVAMRRNRNNG